MLQRYLKDRLKDRYFLLYRLGVRLGWYVIPAHYYASEPNIIELERTLEEWAYPSSMPGVRVELDAQVSDLRRVCLPFRDEYVGNSTYKAAVADHYGPGFGYLEAQLLHAVVRCCRPKRIIEIGSGVSTRCMLEAVRKNARDGAEPGQMTCIEPYPSAALRVLAAAEGSIALIDRRVQSVGFDIYDGLGPGDILFVDSSHVVRAGSDVNHVVLEVLPRLHDGVLVHFHDIYFPYDYQRDVLKTFLHANETSLLQAFLMFNDRFRILFSLSQLHYDRPDALAEVFPEYVPQVATRGLRDAGSDPAHHFPSSTWLVVGSRPG